MSFSYASTAFALPAADVPLSFGSTDALLHFIQSQIARARDHEQRLCADGHASDSGEQTLLTARVLCGASSSGWFDRVLENVIKECGAGQLAFLTDNEDEAPFVWPDEDWRYRYTILDAARMGAVMNDLRALIDWSTDHTEQVGELIDWYSPAEVAAAVQHTDITWALCTRTEEGIGPDYLFVFLRSFLALLERAHAAGELVVFFQKQPD